MSIHGDYGYTKPQTNKANGTAVGSNAASESVDGKKIKKTNVAPDCTNIIIHHEDGSTSTMDTGSVDHADRDIHIYPDGSKIIIDRDAHTKTIISPDGSQKTILIWGEDNLTL